MNRSQCHILRTAECFCKKGEEPEEEIVSMAEDFGLNRVKSKIFYELTFS
jgi:hypothetical protein